MLIRIIILALLLISAYFLGQSHCQTRTITKEIEVIKYVTTKQNKILSHPNADKHELLSLMHNNQL